jgi:hypothetical protein
LTDDILISIHQKMRVGGIFCNLAKAFDCVSCEILITLHSYGIYGIAAEFLDSI